MKEDTERVPLTERVPEHEQKFPNKNTANKCPVCEQNNHSEKQCLEHLKEKHTECKSNHCRNWFTVSNRGKTAFLTNRRT